MRKSEEGKNLKVVAAADNDDEDNEDLIATDITETGTEAVGEVTTILGKEGMTDSSHGNYTYTFMAIKNGQGPWPSKQSYYVKQHKTLS